MRRCFLHIGAPKTGSTVLEQFLAHNRARLAELGWLYPDVSLRGFGHHDLAFLVGGGYPHWALPQARSLEELQADLNGALAGVTQVVLSSENFYLQPNPPGTASMLAQAGFPAESVTVVVYVRRQDEAHVSWYNQTVKAQGYSGSVAQSLADNHALWDYAARLEPWRAVFPNVTVRRHHTLVGDDIRRDFLQLLGVPPEALAWPEETPNARINRDLLEFQRLANRLPLSAPEKRRFHRELIALSTASQGLGLFEDPPLLSDAQRRTVLAAYAHSNHEVARELLGEESLFDESIDATAPGSDSWSGLTTEKLVYALEWILLRGRASGAGERDADDETH